VKSTFAIPWLGNFLSSSTLSVDEKKKVGVNEDEEKKFTFFPEAHSSTNRKK
jgi:hypothetical protein